MILAVASGKGGTGKTTVAVSLALALSEADPIYVDCDVEEPNAALFLRPELTETREAIQLIPEVDADKCTACGRCAEVCRYHAISVIGQEVLVFEQLCHGCGSCTLQCPVGAIREVPQVIGKLEQGHVDGIGFAQGELGIGEAMAPPVIRQLKRWALPPDARERTVILDAPPGTACPLVETLHGADVALLVTEPTPFGLHDLRATVDVARGELGLPVAVVVNRADVGDEAVEDYCAATGIPILMRIPLERAIAEGIAEGRTLVDIHPEYREAFQKLYRDLVALNATARTPHRNDEADI
ncbi:MAG: ATP-binding protein [Anaerolineae bacterium]